MVLAQTMSFHGYTNDEAEVFCSEEKLELFHLRDER